jgi:predicted CopG family antitoxin
MPKMIQVSGEVYEALLDQKHRNDTFDDVIRGVLENAGIIVEDTYDGT